MVARLWRACRAFWLTLRGKDMWLTQRSSATWDTVPTGTVAVPMQLKPATRFPAYRPSIPAIRMQEAEPLDIGTHVRELRQLAEVDPAHGDIVGKHADGRYYVAWEGDPEHAELVEHTSIVKSKKSVWI